MLQQDPSKCDGAEAPCFHGMPAAANRSDPARTSCGRSARSSEGEALANDIAAYRPASGQKMPLSATTPYAGSLVEQGGKLYQ